MKETNQKLGCIPNFKKVTVVGLGRSGLSVALLLQRSLRSGAKVKVTDWSDTEELRRNARLLKSQGIDVELGKHSESFVRESDLIVLSPGVRRNSPAVIRAESKRIPVISEIELAYRQCPAPIIAVTGTNGKTTVATLIGKILSTAKKKVIVCGNIGRPFSGEILKISPQHTVVLEVSSFQLEGIVKFRPHIAVLLNVSEDHLDRYRDFDQYFKTKTLIFSNQKQSDWVVLNYNDPNLRKLKFDAKDKVKFFGENNELNPNYSAALTVSSILGISERLALGVIDNFKGVEHRLEYVDTIKGVKFINDSKATNVSSTIWALEQLPAPIIFIAGGREKKSTLIPLYPRGHRRAQAGTGNFNTIINLVTKKVKAVVLIGEAKQKIKKVLAGKVLIREADCLDEAVLLAKQMAVDGDSVLFSPMCASFDMFKNFEERGRVFKEIVKKDAQD